MKKLLVTMSDDSVSYYTKYTIPIFEMFAKKWKADFKILTDISYNDMGHAMWNYRTMIFHELFCEYDRIAYFDGDIVINKNCPDVYSVVPFDAIGFVLEDKGSRRKVRLDRIKTVKQGLGEDVDWSKDYFNGGFYIVSSVHKDVFKKIDGKLWNGCGYDSTHYMHNIKRHGFNYIDLGYKFNHMSMFSESWNGSPSRFDSYIIHYAGGGKFSDKGEMDWVDLMKNDIELIYGTEMLCVSSF